MNHGSGTRSADRGSAAPFGIILVTALLFLVAGLVSPQLFSLATPVDPAPNAHFSAEYVPDGEGNTNYRPYVVLRHEAGRISDGTAVFVADDAGNRVAWADVWTGGPVVASPEFVHVDGFESDGALRPICEAGQRYRIVAEGADGRSWVLREYVVPHDPVLRHDEIRAACGAGV